MNKNMPDGCRAVVMLHILSEAALIMKEVRLRVGGTLESRIDKFIDRVDRVVPNLMNGGCDVQISRQRCSKRGD